MIKFLTDRIIPPGSEPEDPAVRSRAGKFSGRLGICANVLLFLGKLLVGILSGSVSVTADAMNNLTDASSAIVTLLGFKLAEKPADEHHPYGHARYEYLSGLAVAGLMAVIAVELGKSAVERIFRPEPVVFSGLLVGVLASSIGVKLLLTLINTRLGRTIKSQALLATAADSRNDCVATGAVLLSALFTHLTQIQIDGVMGLGVAVFILVSGIRMARQTVSPLLGERVDPRLEGLIVSALKSDERILGYHDLMVHDYGPGRRFASVHVEMDLREDPLLCHTVIDNIERRCYEQHRSHLVIHYDPVVTDDEELNEMRRQVEMVLRSIDPRIDFHDFRMARSESHTDLIFDMLLPLDMVGKERQVKTMLDTAINLKAQTRYNTVITFDEAAFNPARRQDNRENF